MAEESLWKLDYPKLAASINKNDQLSFFVSIIDVLNMASENRGL